MADRSSQRLIDPIRSKEVTVYCKVSGLQLRILAFFVLAAWDKRGERPVVQNLLTHQWNYNILNYNKDKVDSAIAKSIPLRLNSLNKSNF